MEFFNQKAIENNWNDKKQVDVLLRYIENIFFEDFLINLNTSSELRLRFYKMVNNYNLSFEVQKNILSNYLEQHVFNQDNFAPFSKYIEDKEQELA